MKYQFFKVAVLDPDRDKDELNGFCQRHRDGVGISEVNRLVRVCEVDFSGIWHLGGPAKAWWRGTRLDGGAAKSEVKWLGAPAICLGRRERVWSAEPGVRHRLSQPDHVVLFPLSSKLVMLVSDEASMPNRGSNASLVSRVPSQKGKPAAYRTFLGSAGYTRFHRPRQMAEALSRLTALFSALRTMRDPVFRDKWRGRLGGLPRFSLLRGGALSWR